MGHFDEEYAWKRLVEVMVVNIPTRAFQKEACKREKD
jgi:hypothetical protein